MTFIVTLIALVIERFFDWSHLRKWTWFNAYERSIMQKVTGSPPYVALAAIVLPPIFAVALVGFVIKGWMFGLVTLMFQLAVFIYCLGPQNLWADTFGCINALIQGDRQFVADKLKVAFGISNIDSPQTLQRNLLNTIFIEANRRIFAIIFWFLLLGPIGAILYRTIAFTAATPRDQGMSPEVIQKASRIEAILDWAPNRILTFVFALGGHFAQVFSVWRKKVLHGLDSNEPLLTECGNAALGVDGISAAAGTLEKGAVSLLDRTFVIVLVLLAVVVLLF